MGNKDYRQAVMSVVTGRILPEARRIALKHFDDSFANQGFTDKIYIPWKARKDERRVTFLGGRQKIGAKAKEGRSILVGTGRLRRGTKAIISGQSIIITNNVPYAQVHNRGFKGVVSVKAHTRERYIKTYVKGAYRGTAIKQKKQMVEILTSTTEVGAYTRRMNVPKRTFAAPSAEMVRDISAMAMKELKKAIKR